MELMPRAMTLNPRHPGRYWFLFGVVPVRGYDKECSGENAEFVGIAA
jgi:hypothetical protein